MKLFNFFLTLVFCTLAIIAQDYDPICPLIPQVSKDGTAIISAFGSCPNTAKTHVTVHGKTFQVGSTAIIITPTKSDQKPITITAGAKPTTVDGEPISWMSNGHGVAIGTATIPFIQSAQPAKSTHIGSGGGAGSGVKEPFPSGNIIKTSIRTNSKDTHHLETIVDTFVPTTYNRFTSLTAKTTILTTITIGGSSTAVPLVIGPGGVGYQIPKTLPSGLPLLSVPVPGATTPPTRATTTTALALVTWPPAATDSITLTTGYSSNTYSTTTSNGHEIIFPIIGGGSGGSDGGCGFCPPCFIFCPPDDTGGNFGIILPPLDPGIYPSITITAPSQPPGINIFPTPPPITFPRITIGPDEIPTYSEQSTFSTDQSTCSSTATVTDKTIYVSYGVDSSVSKTTATSTITTKEEVKSGCSISASTVTSTTAKGCPSGGTRELSERQASGCESNDYYVLPKSFTDLSTNKVIQQKLDEIAAAKKEKVFYSGVQDDVIGIDWWTLSLTDEELETVKNLPGVLAVPPTGCEGDGYCATLFLEDDFEYHNDSSYYNSNFSPTGTSIPKKHRRALAKRDLDVVKNPESVPELGYISLPPKHKLDQTNDRYLYDKSAGQGVTVYMIEYGINIWQNGEETHKEYSEFSELFSPGRLDFGGPNYKRPVGESRWPVGDRKWWSTGGSETPPDIQHGTRVLSKLVSKSYGVSKNINIVVAQFPPDSTRNKINYEGMMSVFSWIQDDWVNNRRKNSPSGVAVINMSFGLRIPRSEKWYLREHLAERLRACAKDGLLLVVCGDNKKPDDSQNSCYLDPQQLLDPSNRPTLKVPTMLVVGGLNEKLTSIWSRGRRGSCDEPWFNMWAPAQEINLIDSNEQSTTHTGTSYAAPAVAGVLAYFAALRETWPNWNNGKEDYERNAKKLFEYSKALSYVREGAEELSPLLSPLKGIYNGMPWDYYNCGDLPKKNKRTDGESSQSPGNSCPLTTAPKCVLYGPQPPYTPSGYCSCSGSTFSPVTSLQSGTVNSCAFKTLPTVTYNPLNKQDSPFTTISSLCLKGSMYAPNGADWTSIPNCTPAPTSKPPKQCSLDVWEHVISVPGINYGVTTFTPVLSGKLHGPGGAVLDKIPYDHGIQPSESGVVWKGSGVEVEVVKPYPQYGYVNGDKAEIYFKSGPVEWSTKDTDDKKSAFCHDFDWNSVPYEGRVRTIYCEFPCTCDSC